MTWVVAGKHLFCVRAISDIQVTLELNDGNTVYIDGVKKVHNLSNRVTILFSGHIKLAFQIIEKLKAEYMRYIDDRLHQEPIEIMKKLKRAIKHYYKQMKTNHNNHVEFMLLVAPTGIFTEFGMFKLVSPAFKPVERKEPFEMLELGSGAQIKEYRDIVENNARGAYVVEQGKDELPALVIPVGKVAMQYVFSEALAHQNAGISGAMHITLLVHDGAITRELPETPEGAFPKVASSWKELSEICRNHNIALGECIASA